MISSKSMNALKIAPPQNLAVAINLDLSILFWTYVKREKRSIRTTGGLFIELVKIGDESTILYDFELFIFAVSFFFGVFLRDFPGRRRGFIVIHLQKLFQTLFPVIHCRDHMPTRSRLREIKERCRYRIELRYFFLSKIIFSHNGVRSLNPTIRYNTVFRKF